VDESSAMRRAIDLAARGLGTTSPNPVVGCVILNGYAEVVGEGWHEQAGGAHAEIVALEAAGERTYGGTVVVTLEPCAHTGRTAPCTEALIAARPRRVVYAVADPAHGGAEVLRAAGIEVEDGLLAEEAAQGNEAWLHAVRTGRPFVTWKYAATLDGRCAAADGTSRWVTGEEARRDVHRLRAESDAVMVGIGTVLADDPALTVRHVPHHRQPLRVVLDTDGITPPTAQVRPALVLTAADVKRGEDGRIHLHAALQHLYERGVRSVLLEGGPTLAGAFVKSRLVDKVIAYVAPKLLGAGPPALADASIRTIGDAMPLRLTDLSLLGPDVRLTCYPEGC
jgi:diaminohydroxyphosphoribosylaminopyrimidine deaminase/5-amino-6-(5-phosphoribosylamino)uracil reductase